MSCLYILEINPLSLASFADVYVSHSITFCDPMDCRYFLHSEGCHFILFMVSFVMQNLLILLRYHLFILVFIFINLGMVKKRSCWDVSREQHQNMYIIYSETDDQPRLAHMLGPGALGRPRGVGWRGRWEGGSGLGTHVDPWLIHVNV